MAKVCIIGLQGGGKSHLVKEHFLKHQEQHLVIDPMDEYVGFTRYVPSAALMESYDGINEEIKLIHKKFVFPHLLTIEDAAKGKVKPKRLKMLVYEEADLYVPSQKLINASVRNIYVKCRHMQLDVIAVTRRPTDLNAYIMDTADYLIVFKITGNNAIKSIANMNADAKKALIDLSYEKHEFLLMDRSRAFEVYTLDTLPEDRIEMINR